MAIPFSGILEIGAKHFGFVRGVSLTMKQTPTDAFISPNLHLKYKLRAGVFVEGTAEEKRGKSPEAKTVERVNGLSTADWVNVKEFSAHEVVSPNEVIKLEGADASPAGRLVRCYFCKQS